MTQSANIQGIDSVEDHRDDVPVFVHSEIDDSALDVYEIRVYLTLSRRAGRGGMAYESVPNMAKRIGMSSARLRQALRALEGYHLVSRVERPGETSIYKMLPRVMWTLPMSDTPTPGVGVPQHQVSGTPTPGVAKGTPTKVLPGKEKGKVKDVVVKDDGAEQIEKRRQRAQDDADEVVKGVVDAWNAECGKLAKARVVSKDVERLTRDLMKRHGPENVVPLVRAATSVVRDDPHWLGKQADAPLKRNGPAYGLVNLLRHVEDKANIAVEEIEEATNWSDVKIGSTWYASVGIVKIHAPGDSPMTIQAVVIRPLVDNIARGELVQLTRKQLRTERFV